MSKEVAIKAEGVFKSFKLPHERTNSVKSTFLNLVRRKRGYEVQRVLKDVSFEIQKGEFFGIVGRNGSGKSTLLKMLAGIYTPTKGNITVNGSLTPFIELGVGFNPELSGRENVYLNGALLGFNNKEVDGMYDDIVNFAELERFMDQKLKNYSSGMQVRLAFSIAIRARGDILLLDEVLAVGDAAFQQKCYDYFEELKRSKKTVVFVSHDISAVNRFCTRAIYIKDGNLLKIGDAQEISDIYVKENIAPSNDNAGKEDSDNTNAISVVIEGETNDEVRLSIKYRSNWKSKVFVGISILAKGVSIAEVSTERTLKLMGEKGSMTYALTKEIFNAGSYQIGAGLFTLDNREILASSERVSFTVSGYDMAHGGMVKISEHGWQGDEAKHEKK